MTEEFLVKLRQICATIGGRRLHYSKNEADPAPTTYMQYCSRREGCIHYEVYEHRGTKIETGFYKPGRIYCELHLEHQKWCSVYWNGCLRNLVESGVVVKTDWGKVDGIKCHYAIRLVSFDGFRVDLPENELIQKIHEALLSLFETLEPVLQQFENSEIQKRENEKMDKLIQMLENAKQLILTGAPGTGKTHKAIEMANLLIKQYSGCTLKVQFHPGYDYSDFVIGLKPVLGKDGSSVSYEWKPGVFKVFADQAKKAYDEAVGNNMTSPKYVMIIDEINRADLSRVFGELFSLIEADYRYRRDGEKVINGEGVVLPNGERFVIPDNLYIIGTMNDIDRSVESMDFALRRRFAWHEINAKDSESSILDACIGDEAFRNTVKAKMAAINQYLGDYGDVKQQEVMVNDGRKRKLPLGAEYQLGGAYFRKIKDESGFAAAWENGISVILSEYLRGMRDKDAVLEFLKRQYENAGK